MSNNIKEIPESPEAVAYKLMQDVLKAEAKAFSDLNPRNTSKDDILNTYKALLRKFLKTLLTLK